MTDALLKPLRSRKIVCAMYINYIKGFVSIHNYCCVCHALHNTHAYRRPHLYFQIMTLLSCKVSNSRLRHFQKLLRKLSKTSQKLQKTLFASLAHLKIFYLFGACNILLPLTKFLRVSMYMYRRVLLTHPRTHANPRNTVMLTR